MTAANLLRLTLLLFSLLAAILPASAQSPLAVVKSDKNAQTYSEQHLGTFDDDWLSFKRTLENANVRYDLLGDADLKAGSAKLSAYKMIMLPFFLDISDEGATALSEYVSKGGKLLITDGGGVPSASAQSVNRLSGVIVSGHTTMQEGQQLVWSRTPLPLNQDFAVGTLTATIELLDPSAGVGKWVDSQGKEIGWAIGRLNSNTYLGWAPGLQGEITTNAQILSLSMEDSCPGITQQAAVQISFADFQNIQQELDYLSRRTEEAIKTAKQADLSVPFKTIQAHYESALAHVKSFQDAYGARRFYQADEELQAARQDFALAFAQSMPVRPVEARSVWLDRGTIITTRNEQGMSALFDRLKSTGINVVYFETNNAGFCMYPTKISRMNPELNGFDPLAAAIKEARRRGMELHAWIWTFAVGNIRHNPIVGREADYPGPVLTANDFSWALAGRSGALLPHNQPEFWIDPSSLAGRQFIKELCREIVANYAVDGFQFDYIRYPFNGKGTEMGFDWEGRLRFERETGLNLDKLDEETRQVWQSWKVAQVNSFVQDTATMLRKIRPGLRISAAVYATPQRLRLGNIQQEWETWVQNGWVDALNPMTYVSTAKELSIAAGAVREATSDRALVFPGLSIRQLDTAGLIEQLDTARAIGTLGTTMFAVAQLDDKKVNVLRLGPYRRTPLVTPQSDPLKASRILVDDFAALVNRYLQDPQKHILSDQASTNEVLSQIESLQQQMHGLRSNCSAQEISEVNKQVVTLQNTIKEWLRIEAFVQRGFRAQYITSYLSQVQAILSYAFHRARTQTQSIAVSGN